MLLVLSSKFDVHAEPHNISYPQNTLSAKGQMQWKCSENAIRMMQLLRKCDMIRNNSPFVFCILFGVWCFVNILCHIFGCV